MTDQLDEIRAALDPDDDSIIPCVNYRWKSHCRWLVAEVGRLREEVLDEKITTGLAGATAARLIRERAGVRK